MGGMGGRSRGNVDNTSLYEALGVSKTASDAEIKKAYRKLAVKHHPDKGGDEQTFKELTKAYEILSSEEKRKLYDEGGEEAVEQGGGGMHDAHDIFSSFFGGGGRRGPRGPKKGEDLVHQIGTTLESMYNGKTVKMQLSRNVICSVCEGSGSKEKGANTTCSDCDGHGVRLVTRQIAPGMIQQMQQQCPACEGKGTTIKPKDRCKECSGKKVKPEKKVIEVQIDKGMKHGQKITLSGAADEAPGQQPGDIVFVIAQKEHAKFMRKGDDLLMTQKIMLSEALCGTKFVIEQLDGRQLLVATEPGAVIKPGDVKAIEDEGMPMYKNPFVKGKLYIKFDVEFPDDASLDAAALAALTKALPPPAKLPAVSDEHEEVTMHKADLEHLGRNAHGQQHQDDDDEDGRGGQRVQCAQQ
uniref:J domain-containing protein n=2 Tax=Hemiselmis andersenii TaxID=464988 RepID=A0A6U4Y5A6_HEMAN